MALCSDHGYDLGEHNGILQKRLLYEQSARSSLITRASGLGSGTVSTRIVEFMGIYPTLTHLAGLNNPKRL